MIYSAKQNARRRAESAAQKAASELPTSKTAGPVSSLCCDAMVSRRYHYEVKYFDTSGLCKAHDFWTDNILREMSAYVPLTRGCLFSVRRGSAC